MIGRCPVCGGEGTVPVLGIARVPLVLALPGDAVPGDDDFAPLDVVACDGCGHMYNRSFDTALAARMYGDTPLTNVPVNVAMVQSIRDVAEWIGPELYAGKRVVEVGSGSGHLARIVAERAERVMIFEPCLGLRPEMLPEANIELVNAEFTADLVPEPADMVICRAVIEHVADPAALIGAIAAVTKPDGHAYLEVPSAEYIARHAAFNGFYLAHVQYFGEPHFAHLAAAAGLSVVRRLELKNGHDFGLLLRRGTAAAAKPPLANGVNAKLGPKLRDEIAKARATLSAAQGRLGLYGATWQSQALLAAVGDAARFAIAFDDNPHFDGAVLHGGGYPLPVEAPSAPAIRSLNTIVVGAYLHDATIARKLRDQGYAGRILSARPDFGTAAEFGAEPLFGEPVGT